MSKLLKFLIVLFLIPCTLLAQNKTIKGKVPDDIALVGFSNSSFGELITPGLTTVKQPAAEMGQTATELLIKLIESKRAVTEFEKVVLQTELIVRDSSAKKNPSKTGKAKKVLN